MYRFCELLTEFGGSEDNSNIVLESLSPLLNKPTFDPQTYDQLPGGEAAGQLCSWLRGVYSLHSTLQTKIRPLQSKLSTMQASLAEYTDRLKAQENKIKILDQRLAGLSVALETASVDKSRQSDLLRAMCREMEHTKQFIEVSYEYMDTYYVLILPLYLTISYKFGFVLTVRKLCVNIATTSYVCA